MNQTLDDLLSPERFSSISYEGTATARFGSPQGEIVLPARAFRSIDGGFIIEMRMPHGREERKRIAHLLAGHTSETQAFVISLFENGNPCTGIVLETDAGTLTTDATVLLEDAPALVAAREPAADEVETLTFSSVRCFYRSKGATQASWWILPLYNFNSPVRHRDPDLDSHPLRPLLTKMSGSRASGVEALSFVLDGQKGFLQLLPSPQTAEIDNSDADVPQPSAILVGATDGFFNGWSDFSSRFPRAFIPLLKLATGCDIRFREVEFRDSAGVVSSRLHLCGDVSPRPSGTASLNPSFGSNSVGFLLSRAAMSSYLRDPFFFVAVDALSRIGRDDLSLDEQVRMLSRVLETCVSGTRQALAPLEDELGSDWATFEGARDQLVRACRELERKHPHSLLAVRLDKLGQRLQQTFTSEPSFSDRVVMLLKSLGLDDDSVLTPYLRQSPMLAGKKTWPSTLSKFRNDAIHKGFLDIQGDYSLQAVTQFSRHLHDLLVRVILRLIAYDGPYESILSPGIPRDPLWVKAGETRANHLGYGVRPGRSTRD